ncbi:MAG: ABC transporter permease [Gemmatimonadales bacterium]|nr:ABC transporter permease [Gemmatimonadales bacterium]
MREWLARLVDWFRRDTLDRELREELQFHAAQLARDARAQGADESAAELAARRRLGNVTAVREQARDRWSWPWLDRFLQDVRHAVRGLARAPGFTAAVVATLGLGIGANAAMFSVIDRLMFRPYPYLRDPDQVHRVYLQQTYQNETILTGEGHEYARYLDLARWSSTLSQTAGFTSQKMAIGTGAEVRERPVAMVSSSFFDFFDIRPAAGRFFHPAEDTVPVGAPVAVLGFRYWRQELGGRDVIGESIRVHDMVLEVVGVAPEGFFGMELDEPPDVFIPITTYAAARDDDDGRHYFDRYNWGWMAIMVRRAPGVTPDQASADLTTAFVRSWNREREVSPRTAPVELARPTAMIGPLKTAAGPTAGLEPKTLLWVAGVAVVVLLIACANVTNLMLARVIRRRRETAVRLALGVSRGRLVAQSLTESLILALAGCATGLVVAQWGGAALRRLFVGTGRLDVVTDWRTLGIAVAAAVGAGLLTGIGPVLLAGRGDLTVNLKSGAREGGGHRSRTRTVLLVFQAALSVILLVGAGLFVRSLERVRAIRLGYDADRIVMVAPRLRTTNLTMDEARALGQRLLAAATGVPGVEHAALVNSVPFWSSSSTYLRVPGVDSVRRLGRFTFQAATPEYFATMGTRVLRGRPFTEADREGSPRVAVVSEAMAAILWPGRDAIGQCMIVGVDSMPCTTVIGVAENAFQGSLTNDKRFRYYLPISQSGQLPEAVLVRVRGAPEAQLEPIRLALQREMPGDAYVNTRTLESLIEGERRSWRVGATMFAAFGGLALLVAAVGLYGVITYDVARRRQELGVRSALGARAPDLARLVVSRSLRLAGSGTAIGLATALIASRWIEPLLYQQSPRDPVTYGVVVAVLLAVAVGASAMPAVRAARADPSSALRSE